MPPATHLRLLVTPARDPYLRETGGVVCAAEEPERMELHGSPSPCVGRDAELQRLASLYREARESGERVAWLEGPSGVGKSRILDEFRMRVRLEGGVVLDGRCEPGRAFGPLADIVEQALRFLREVGVTPTIEAVDLACHDGCHRLWHQHDERRAYEAPRHAASEAEVFEKRLRFFDALRGLLHDVARVRPPVVVLRDLERADQGTLAFLCFLLDAASPLGDDMQASENTLRALIVGSVRAPRLEARPDEGAPDPLARLLSHGTATHVAVGPLDADGVRALLQSTDTVQRILRRTGGLPEAIERLLDAEPPSREARIERWLAALSAPARALVEALSALRGPSDFDRLARVSGAEPETGSRTAFVRAEADRADPLRRTIVDGALLFDFAQEADRDACAALLPAERRRTLHARCAETLAREGDAQEAAHHALAADDVAQAVPLALRAAQSLAARHAHAEAAALLERVLAAATSARNDELSGTVALSLRDALADLYRLDGDYPRALRHATHARDAAPHDPSAARRVGDLLTLSGALDDAARALGEARRLAEADGDPLQTAEVEAALAELHYQRAAYAEAATWAQQACDTAEARGALPLALSARNTLGKVALAQLHPQGAATIFEENRARANAAGLGRQEAQALTNLGVAKLRTQDLAAAEAGFTRAIEVAGTASDTRERAIATENLAVLAHLRHDYARAQRFYNDAVALLKRLGNRAMLARVANNLGELYLSLGDRDRARTLCEFATHVGGAALPPPIAAEGLLLRGRVEAAHEHVGAARAAFEAAHRTFDRLGMARAADALLELTRMALVDGDVAAARNLLARITPPESAKRRAELAIVQADVARAAGDDTLETAREAAALAEQCGDDAVLVLALTRLARACADRGDLVGATGAAELARDAESRLARHVPDDARAHFADRLERRELFSVEALVASSFDRSRQSRPRVPSLPPASATPSDANASRTDAWLARYPDLVGRSAPIAQVLSLLDRVAPSEAIVLIRGESGTGKELVAEALHRHSPRRERPFVKVNCAALVETLLLSELFGHERGAFTGASARRKGRFEVADGGTLFLDEIGDISPKTQVALLRVLQEREFERVGGTAPIKVDVRILCATHRDLEKMVREGSFREDLYYRLRGVTIDVPALRRRREDLPLLCAHLLGRIAAERKEPPKSLAPDALRLLASHAWPGNVRELDNVLRSATLFADDPVLGAKDFGAFAATFAGGDPEPEMAITPSLPPADHQPEGESEIARAYRRIRGGDVSLFEMKKALERECIVRALEETSGNITRAALLLGMKRPRLSQLVKQYELADDAGEA